MLEKIDLSTSLDRDTYKERMTNLSERLYYVQQRSWEKGIPVVIIFEGWDAAGKGTTIHRLTDPIDPRGYRIYPIRAARTYEKKHPWLWRFWLKIPSRGEWAIFDRSWYGRVLVERMEKLVPKDEWQRAYRDIVDFERNLADDGTLILKFFLHISKDEQKKRFDRLEKDELNAWRVTDEDWRNHKRYNKWLLTYEEMLEKTDTEWGVWTIVEATDKRHSLVKVYETIVEALEERLGIQPEPSAPETAGQAGLPPAPPREEVETEMEEAGIPPVAEDLEDADRPPQQPEPAKPAGPTPAQKLKYILSMQDSMPQDTPATSENDPEAGDA